MYKSTSLTGLLIGRYMYMYVYMYIHAYAFMEYACTVLLQIFIGTHTHTHMQGIRYLPCTRRPHCLTFPCRASSCTSRPASLVWAPFVRQGGSERCSHLPHSVGKPKYELSENWRRAKKGLNFTPHWRSIGWCALIRTQRVYIMY